MDLVAESYEQGRRLLAARPASRLKDQGQFLTSPPVARYMAGQLGQITDGARILEPALGSGVLVCAVIERLIQEKQVSEVWIEAYEIDAELCGLARGILKTSAEHAQSSGITVHWQLHQEDFVLARTPGPQPSLFHNGESLPLKFDHILSTPPTSS